MSPRTLEDKVKTLAELADLCAALRAEGKRIVQCHGVFDLLHPGQVRHFEAARAQGDVLVVTVTPDRVAEKRRGRPVFNQRLRAEAIAAFGSVAYAAIAERPSAEDVIRLIRPAVYVKGSDAADAKDDLTGKVGDERRLVEQLGGRIHFITENTFGPSSLLNLHFGVYPEGAQEFLREFRRRHSGAEVIGLLRDLHRLKVLMIGETIIDEYHYVQSMQKSPKELLITTRYVREERFAGGILACANHTAGFCGQVDVVTILGATDSHEEFIRRHLKPNVTPTFFHREDTGTIVKRRYVEQAFLSKMFEVAFLDDGDLPGPVSRGVERHLATVLPRYDVVIVADYGHGFLNRELIRVLAGEARFLAVNVQTNSANLGYNLISKYPRADYVCIDEPEVRLAAHDRRANLEEIIGRLARDLSCRRVSITRGHKGCISYAEPEGYFQVPVLSREIVDRIGAGDAYLSVTAPCVVAGYHPELVGFIGNAVGALAVRIVGNRGPVESAPLFEFITALLQ
jgi:bifunctional ADP-heptose synthase (sugar kinase/adenylyltransferase)